MNFWESELGEVTGKEEDAFAKSFTQIPDGTMALAKIDSFVNAEFNGNKYLSIDWLLIDGDFRGQKVNQKLKVFGDARDKDPIKTRHRALNMLKLIYQLYNIKPQHPNPPADDDLLVFIGKTAGIKIRETEPNAEGKQYNWVSEVHKAQGFKCETGVKLVVNHTVNDDPFDTAFSRNRRGTSNDINQLTDDIPF
jgi:hypothetical protein